MFTRADLEAREAAGLAPYATLSRAARGRAFPEPESGTRTAFQKDRDRILHTTAFRRLEYKTQVFVNVSLSGGQGDHYRTRLTHTLEVSQVARSVALTLGLNETLAEAIALAHDLGHPPFGHAGERALNALMEEHGAAPDNTFDHNSQACRIVTVLEDRYPDFRGLNLTRDTLDGLNKHRRTGLGPPSLEAQLVDAADALAYTAHDLDDGLRSGLLTPEDLTELPIWAELLSRVPPASPSLTERDRRTLHRELLGWLIDDLTRATHAAIVESGVRTPEAVRALPERLVTYSPEMRVRLRETGDFLRSRLYRHWRVEMQVEQGTRLLTGLFTALLSRPSMLPPSVRARAEEGGLPRAVCDYVSGMTDRYAAELHAALRPPVPGAGWR